MSSGYIPLVIRNFRKGEQWRDGFISTNGTYNRLAQIGLGRLEASGNLGKIPDGFNGSFGHNRLSRRQQNLSIGLEPTGCDRLATFGQVNVGFRDSLFNA